MNDKESLEKVELNIYHNLCDISKVCRKFFYERQFDGLGNIPYNNIKQIFNYTKSLTENMKTREKYIKLIWEENNGSKNK